MTREEYLAKRRAYYQKNKHKWAEYAKAHRKEINKYWREKRAEKPEKYREKAAEWRDTFEERHGWAPDYDYETRKTNADDISYRYANPDVTKAFKMLDGEEVDNVE